VTINFDDRVLFEIAGTPVSVATLLTVGTVLAATFLISYVLRRGLERAMVRRGSPEGIASAAAGLAYYAALLLGGAVALQTAGIQLTALFTAGAVFAVGLGLALQNIGQNFVSGVVLLAERSIKPGDVVEVEGRIVQIQRLGVRAMTARSRDGEDLIIPNSVLVQSTIKNYTFKDSAFRVRATVGVSYRSDMARVRKALERVATEMSAKWGVVDSPWQVIMAEFGSSSVNWEIAIWMQSPWEMRKALSEVYEAVWWTLAEEKIVIAFPQLDVHFDPTVEAGLRKVGVA